MPGLLDIIGALTNASRTSGGIQTMPDGSLSYSPMQTAKPGWDQFLTGGQGRRRAQQFNDVALAGLLEQQEAGKNQINMVREQGIETRLSKAEEARLQKEIEQLRAQLADKQNMLKQNLDVGASYGIPLVNPEDIKVMGGALTDPAIKSALQQMIMSIKARGTPEAQTALNQGVVAGYQAPAIANLDKSRFQTAPATTVTAPQMQSSGLIDFTSPGNVTTGLTPFSRETQNMIQLPGGMSMPGNVTRETGYSKPRPSRLKTENSTNSAPVETMPPQAQNFTPPAGTLGAMLRGSGMWPTQTQSGQTESFTGVPATAPSIDPAILLALQQLLSQQSRSGQ